MFEKKTKIICTISDMNCETEFIRQLYYSGMNVARINSAHASIEGARRIVDNIRSISDKIGILVDTKGTGSQTDCNGVIGGICRKERRLDRNTQRA